MKNYFIYLILAVALLASCDKKEDYEQINSNAMEAAGEWWVDYNDGTGGSGYYKLHTYNTASDLGDTIWIDDVDEFWVYKVKCPVNIEDLTFSGTGLTSVALWDGEPYDITVNITNGKIIKNAVTNLASGVTADSIYFEIEFEDDPGTIYQAAGFRKTGFVEDEH
ncbi:lipid-binding protein [Sunxiuqinia sp. A32]|uniref:lipid-binding protein n=1 Tax=Sunxiuqinia sp. A32 TaxID=3461496 RepID=UPI004045DC3F